MFYRVPMFRRVIKLTANSDSIFLITLGKFITSPLGAVCAQGSTLPAGADGNQRAEGADRVQDWVWP